MKLCVWVDAICINQDNLYERAAEVKKMGLIYSQCLSVRAWLGHPDPDVAAEIPSTKEYLDSISICMHDLRWEAIKDMGVDRSIWAVMSSLASTPYWERLWIVQEIALAPSLLFNYGQHVFTTDEVQKLGHVVTVCLNAKKLGDHGDSEPKVVVDIARIFFRLVTLRPPNRTESKIAQLDIVNLVHLARDSKATDPRDKVFGLLALLPHEVTTRIHPNYNAWFSVENALTMFSKSYLLAEGNMNFLARIRQRPRRPLHMRDLPSWALDLEGPRDWSDVPLNSVRHRNHGTNLGMPMTDFTFSKDDRLMFCEGAIVDSIASLAHKWFWNPEMEAEYVSEIQTGTKRSAPFAYSDWRLSLARVLVQDSYFEFSECPTVLDIPWVESEEVNEELDYDIVPRDIRYYHFSERITWNGAELCDARRQDCDSFQLRHANGSSA